MSAGEKQPLRGPFRRAKTRRDHAPYPRQRRTATTKDRRAAHRYVRICEGVASLLTTGFA